MNSGPTNPHPVRSAIIAALLVNALMLTVAVPLILSDRDRSRAAYDQQTFHFPAILKFSREWPHFDFRDYTSATTPGYHVALSWVDRFISHDLHVLRLFGMIFAVGLLATLAAAVARHVGVGRAVILCVPLICSVYTLTSAAFLLPDDIAWWGVLVVLLLALRKRVDPWTHLAGGVLILALVLVRQSAIWSIAPLTAAACIGNERQESRGQITGFSLVRGAGMMLAAVPALLTIAWFVHLWHGMTPPNQRSYVAGTNAAGAAIALAVAGMWGVFYLPLFWSELKHTPWGKYSAIGFLVGCIAGAVPLTTYDVGAGRYSGIWNAVKHFGYWHGHSPLIIAMSAFGGAVIGAWLATTPIRERLIWLVTIIAFGAAQFATHNAFQRYDEPMVLLVAALAASRAADKPRWAWAGPILLSGVLLYISIAALG